MSKSYPPSQYHMLSNITTAYSEHLTNVSMEEIRNNPKRRRSHSLNSLHSDETLEVRLKNEPYVHRTNSGSSVDFSMHLDSEERPMDSGICDRMFEGDMLVVLEQKIDRLNEMFLEQSRLLTAMKEEIRSSKVMMEKTEFVHNQILVDMLKNTIAQRVKSIDMVEANGDSNEAVNTRAKTLLDAIESKKEAAIDFDVRASLISFLQSGELKEQMVRATSESVRELIARSFRRDVSTLYLPVLERSHRRLIGHIHRIIEQAFIELEDKSSSLFKSVYKTSGALRRALERHQCLLEASAVPDKNIISTLQDTVEELFQKELKEWRKNFTEMLSSRLQSQPLADAAVEFVTPLDYAPLKTPQPASCEVSIIDQMMQKALIKKKIEDGDVNGSFELALSAADLTLVLVACKAVDPAKLFAAPCSLKQHVLLSLVQQLATDMLQETCIKCVFMEQAILNLDVGNPDTRAHLPLVVSEVHKHLSKFLATYPNHVAGKRIMLIVMAANKLLL